MRLTFANLIDISVNIITLGSTQNSKNLKTWQRAPISARKVARCERERGGGGAGH